MEREIAFTLNGVLRSLKVRSHHSLLDVFRNQLRLSGPREVCGLGICGACTVLLNQRPIASCVLLAPFADGGEILTVEGLAGPDGLHPLQEAFIEQGAFQCGFCTPGMLMMAKALLDEDPRPTPALIRAYMAGSLCRCTSYFEIIRAIQQAAGGLKP